jgi:AsmA protein
MTRPRRPLRIALLAVAAVIVIAAGTVAVLIARFDPNAYKPDIIAAVQRATGRDLALNGPIALKASLWPTIQMQDVTFSNPPGFSRPQMASLQGLELQLALLPILSGRIEIGRLVLLHPDILLETDAAGRANWQMTPQSAPADPQAPATKPGGGTTMHVSVASVRIQDGTMAYRDGHTTKTTTLGLPKMEVSAASPDSPLHVDADARFNGAAFTLTGDTGSLARLQDTAAATPWPVKLTLTVGSAKLSADGTLTRPLQGKGYQLAVNGTVPDAAALTPLLQGTVPPPLHDVSFAARMADTGGALPEVSALTLHVGPSDLGAQMPGLTLDHLDIAAAAADQPAKATAAGKLGDQALNFAATTGPLAALMPGAAPAPFPIDAALQTAGATISAKGSIADAQAMTGANLALAAQIPDLAALSPLARRPLPAVKQVAFQGTLTDLPGGFHAGAAVRGLTLTSADGDIAGDATIGLVPKTNITANLRSNRIDLDALQAAVDQTPPPAPSGAKPSTPPTSPSTSPPAPAPRPKRGERLFSDEPIPFDLLRTVNADLTLAIADLHGGGVDYKAIATHAIVIDGKLTISPFAADLPGGHLSGSVTADATQKAPPVHIVLHAPGLALKTILTAVHEPSYANGNLEVYADLQGAGVSPHAIAASLGGSLGLAMAGGTIDNRLLGSLLGKVMNTLKALDLVGKGGDSTVKCFGLRMDAQHGIGTIKPLALSSSLLTMTGAGTINLGEETLALILAPQARIAGTGVVIPVNVDGPIRDPAVNVNRLGAAERNAGTVAGAVLGSVTPLGIVGGLLGGDKLLGGNTDICPAALAAARGQAAPSERKPDPGVPGQPKTGVTNPGAPNPGAPNPGVPNPGAPDPGAFLKNLFR